MITTKIKNQLNALLRPLNLKIETLTYERREMARLLDLVKNGYFEQPIAPILESFRNCNVDSILDAIRFYAKDFAKVAKGGGCTSFQSQNDYYTSPDADILYALTRMLKPKKIIEVGAGNSTLLFREAIHDEGMSTELVSIDPLPRRDISRFVDRFLEVRLETAEAQNELLNLKSGDFLFIDSSHELKTGNDVMRLFLQVLPFLPTGVIIHIHDIFLPFEYPVRWVINEKREWGEQYIVNVLLQESKNYEVIWPGYYLQRTMPSFSSKFPYSKEYSAQSLWIKKTGINI